MLETLKQKKTRVKSFHILSQSQHAIDSKKKKNLRENRIFKTISHKLIQQQTEISPKEKLHHFRSQTTATHHLLMPNLYQKFVKELDIILPSPKEKFYEFMQIPPFNRNNHHLQLIEHFLKQYKFFKNHPNDALAEVAKKVKIANVGQINEKLILVVETGECFYNKERYEKGDIVGRKEYRTDGVICIPKSKFITINRHQYLFIMSSYLDKEKQKFKNFLLSVQIFKMFSQKAFDKFIQNLSINFFSEGEYLYRFGDEATKLYIVFQGRASRKVIVEVDKMNRIPMLKYSKIVKILSKSYEHKIQFQSEDLIGISEVIDHIQTRKQNIKIEQSSIILGLDRIIFQQKLDEYIIDRLRKYNLKKYPITYDKLCEKFEKDQILVKQEEMRKIDALKSTITNDITQKKYEKIQHIIKNYQNNIKNSQIRNLLECKIHERKVQRE